jgi:hypothetical protein
VDVTADNVNTAGGHLPLILAHVSSPHLQEVKLTFDWERPGPHYSNWAYLDKVLEQSLFSQLRWIRIMNNAKEQLQTWMERNIRCQLRGCSRRGQLILQMTIDGGL